jgi:serine/threonine protein phosphatase 1
MKYVIGDPHGTYKALKQCLERSKFNYEEDTLITLGDICDGYSEVYECVEELLKIKHRIDIRGNHDSWFRTFLNTGIHPVDWLQGGDGTLKSYCNNLDIAYFTGTGKYVSDLDPTHIPIEHIEFFNNQIPYYLDKDNNVFVHGGLNRHFPIDDAIYNKSDILMWDRDLWYQALSFKSVLGYEFKNDFNEIFLGHTSTINWKTDLPMHSANVWNLDTGAGYNGKLTIMNVETKEFWQSDNVRELYHNEWGR